jgi:hypothetical protein
MNSDIVQIYEINLQKNYDLLDAQIAKSLIYEEEYLDTIISSMDNLLSITSKTTKDYIIGLTLNGKNYQNSSKIKKAEKNLKDYQKKIKDIKSKHKSKNKFVESSEIIPKYNRDDMTQKVGYNSFNKVNYAIRVTTEIENMSGNILNDLNDQSNTMKNETKRIGEMNDDLDVSKGYLSQMISKQNSDKKIIIVFGTFLFMITFCFMIYKIYQKFHVQK